MNGFDKKKKGLINFFPSNDRTGLFIPIKGTVNLGAFARSETGMGRKDVNHYVRWCYTPNISVNWKIKQRIGWKSQRSK